MGSREKFVDVQTRERKGHERVNKRQVFFQISFRTLTLDLEN